MVVGLVGVGNWGKHILRDLRSLGATVHATASHASTVENARQGGAATVTREIEDLPAECQGFVVANRTIDHVQAVRRLLPRGKPIFVEKPLSADLDAVRSMPDSAQALVFVMHKWRYHPGVLALAAIAASEEFGPVQGLRTFRLSGAVLHRDVNPIWILLPHDLSIALEILGEIPSPRSAMRDPLSAPGGGLIARLSTSNPSLFVVAEVSSSHAGRLRRIVLSCRDAICELSDERYDTLVISLRTGDGSERLVERSVGTEMPLLEELRAFLDFLRGGAAPKTPLRDELRLIEVISTLERMALV